MAELSDSPEDIQAAPAMQLLEKLKAWSAGSVYVFHNPPEAGEILEDVDADMANRFALAAQMSDDRWEACRDAFRRMFSRAVVQRVVLVKDDDGTLDPARIDEIFADLASYDISWAGEWVGRFAVGLREFDPEIFSGAESPEFNLRNSLEAVAQSKGLNIKAVDNL